MLKITISSHFLYRREFPCYIVPRVTIVPGLPYRQLNFKIGNHVLCSSFEKKNEKKEKKNFPMIFRCFNPLFCQIDDKIKVKNTPYFKVFTSLAPVFNDSNKIKLTKHININITLCLLYFQMILCH